MKKYLFILLIIPLFFTSCSDEDEQRCTTCVLDIEFYDYSEFDVCELENGNAEIKGDDTGMDYDKFIFEFEAVGYSCD